MVGISVIVPVYKVENKIRRCIDSILEQSFTDFELILVDDGSPDKSGEICDEYAKTDARVKVIHQENKGASSARNRGIKESKGTYLSFVDSDDYIAPDFLSSLYEMIIRENADMVMCNLGMVKQGKVTSIQNHTFFEGTIFSSSGIQEVIYNNIFYNRNTAGYFSLCNKLFCRSIIKQNAIIIDETMSFGEDMLFVMDYFKYCKSVIFTSKALYYYELTSEGLFSKYRRSFIDDIIKCYTSLIEQTKPKTSSEYDCISLSLKYWYYVNRYIIGIIQNEKNINLKIIKVLSKADIIMLFKRIAAITDEDAKKHHIAQNELKGPRLIANNKFLLAAIVMRYQLDSNYFLRKIMRNKRNSNNGG